jgi:hypothetical protein
LGVLIIALLRFESPTVGREPSAAVQALNAEGELGWEAVGMTVLADKSGPFLLKRPLQADDLAADRSLLRRLRAARSPGVGAVSSSSGKCVPLRGW